MALSKGLRTPEDYYNCLTPIIQDVYREVVAMKKEAKIWAVKLMDEVVDHVVIQLKAVDETFEQVYRDKRPVGSYFDGLRVTEPTEFDVNLVLQFPFQKLCKVISSTPGYVRVRIDRFMEEKTNKGKTRLTRIDIDPKIEQMIGKKSHIVRNNVLSWWQSIFTKANLQGQEVIMDNVRYLLTWKTSGPAVTLHVECLSHSFPGIDIDLVPVMSFNDTNAAPPTPVYQSRRDTIIGFPKEWYIVPKPIKEDDTERRWRLSLTDQEKIIMRGKEQLKPVNRLLKRLRDKNGWNALNSYMIKNVFLHETQHASLYNEQNIGYLFIKALSTLKEYLTRKNLPYYWDTKRNMFINIPKPTKKNITACIQNILAKIDSLLNSPQQLEKYVRSIFI